MLLSHAVDIFLLSKEIAGLSPNTLRNYRLTHSRLCRHLEPDYPELASITTQQLRAFLHHLQTKPQEAELLIPRKMKPLGPKSLRNVHATLSSLFGWAEKEQYVKTNVASAIQPPRPQQPPVEPFDTADIEALLAATRAANQRLLQLRDRALLMFLLDTGVRASELCGLRIADASLKAGAALVTGKRRYDGGRGRQRTVLFGGSTRRVLHGYLLLRGQVKTQAPLFATKDGMALRRRHLAKHVARLGEKAGLSDCYPHRFRHTFATDLPKRHVPPVMLVPGPCGGVETPS